MKSVAAVVSATLAAALVGLWGAGQYLSAPATSVVGPPPAALNADSVSIATRSTEVVSGWFARGERGRGAVLLLHGVRSDRRHMLARALRLHASGYSVLLVDLPAHGESSGARITFGYREAEGVRASLGFLNDSVGDERIAVVGVSLGAASFVLADAHWPPSAVVLESMYSTIDDAVSNRLRLRGGSFGALLTPLLTWQLPIRLGVSAEQLRPIDRVARLRSPVLIAAGTADEHTTLAETRRIFAAAPEPKDLWLVDGAAHVDLYDFNPRSYEAKVFGFLAEHLMTKAR